MTAKTPTKAGPLAAGAALVIGGVVLLSKGVLDLGDRWEGEGQYTVYADKLAGGLPTVCEGLTKHVTTTPIVVGEVWSPEKCRAERLRALEAVQRRVRACFGFQPPQTVFEAASDHAWNFGAPKTCGSDAMKAWNRQEWELGCRRLAFADDGRRIWSSVKTGRLLPNGKPEYRFVRGLANRRDAEMAHCLSGLS